MEAFINLTQQNIHSYTQASDLTSLLRRIIEAKEFTSIVKIISLLNEIKQVCKQKSALQFTIRNIIEKIQIIILEQSLENNLDVQQKYPAETILSFKRSVLNELENLGDEIESLSHNINQFAEENINSNEIIVTFDYSDTILQFLIEANKTRKFEVIVVCCNNKHDTSHKMAQMLSKNNIQTALVLETAVYAIMQRANKVIIGAHAIMKNGGILCQSGGLLLAIAAQSFSVPFLIISAMYKLTPKFPLNQSSYNEQINPGEVFPRKNGDRDELVDVYVKKFNYIPPENISLYITNLGKHTPAHVQLLFAEFYGSDEMIQKLKEIKQEKK